MGFMHSRCPAPTRALALGCPMWRKPQWAPSASNPAVRSTPTYEVWDDGERLVSVHINQGPREIPRYLHLSDSRDSHRRLDVVEWLLGSGSAASVNAEMETEGRD